jgi:RimJ/RimL family protein N-acetyltransferase
MQAPSFDPDPGGDAPQDRVLTTERLTLRPAALGDFEASAALWADEAVVRYIGGRPSSAEEVWARLLRYIGHWSALGYGFWAAHERAGGRFVGEIGFADFQRDLPESFTGAPEAGWAFTPAAQGQGLASEALAAALGWGDRHFGPGRRVCLIHPDNGRSVRLAERHGFSAYLRTVYRGAPTLLLERGVAAAGER